MKQHPQRFLTFVNEAKKRIKEISPSMLKEKIDKKEPVTIMDVREDNEWPTGHIPLAIHMGKGVIERDIENEIPDSQSPIVVYCSGGFRSVLVADNLQKMGYTNVYSLENGLRAWIDAGFSIEK